MKYRMITFLIPQTETLPVDENILTGLAKAAKIRYALQLTENFSASIISRYNLLPRIGSFFWHNVGRGKSKLTLLLLLLFAFQVNGHRRAN